MKTRTELVGIIMLLFFPFITATAQYENNYPGTIDRRIDEISPYELSFNLGYGIITNRTKGLKGENKKFEENLSNGLTWDIRFSRYWKINIGWGLMYSGYNASAMEPGNSGIEHSILLTYIAPVFVGKTAIGRVELKYGAGMGYLGYRNKVSDSYNEGKVTGTTLGINAAFGVDYKFSRQFALGVELSTITGSFGKLNYDNLVDPGIVSSDERMGAARINLLVGLRYYWGNWPETPIRNRRY